MDVAHGRRTFSKKTRNSMDRLWRMLTQDTFILGLFGLFVATCSECLAEIACWTLYLSLASVHYLRVVGNTTRRRLAYNRLHAKGQRIRLAQSDGLRALWIFLQSSLALYMVLSLDPFFIVSGPLLSPFFDIAASSTSFYMTVENLVNSVLLYAKAGSVHVNSMTIKGWILTGYIIILTFAETHIILFRSNPVVGKMRQILNVWGYLFVMLSINFDVGTEIENSFNPHIEPTRVGEFYQLYVGRSFKFACMSDHILWNAIREVPGIDYKDFVVNDTFSQNLYNSQMAEAAKTSEGARFVLAILYASEKQTRKMELNPGLEAQLHATIKSCQDIQGLVDYWGT
jgi:hypothetical protein